MDGLSIVTISNVTKNICNHSHITTSGPILIGHCRLARFFSFVWANFTFGENDLAIQKHSAGHSGPTSAGWTPLAYIFPLCKASVTCSDWILEFPSYHNNTLLYNQHYTSDSNFQEIWNACLPAGNSEEILQKPKK